MTHPPTAPGLQYTHNHHHQHNHHDHCQPPLRPIRRDACRYCAVALGHSPCSHVAGGNRVSLAIGGRATLVAQNKLCLSTDRRRGTCPSRLPPSRPMPMCALHAVCTSSSPLHTCIISTSIPRPMTHLPEPSRQRCPLPSALASHSIWMLTADAGARLRSNSSLAWQPCPFHMRPIRS